VRKADSLRSRRSAGSTRKALDHVRKADSLRSRRSAGSTWLADYLGLSYREPPRLSAPLCKRFAPPSKMAIDSIARDLRRRKKCETWAQRSPLALESRRCARPLLGSYPSDEESATPAKSRFWTGRQPLMVTIRKRWRLRTLMGLIALTAFGLAYFRELPDLGPVFRLKYADPQGRMSAAVELARAPGGTRSSVAARLGKWSANVGHAPQRGAPGKLR
jgi:hypothetical protein